VKNNRFKNIVSLSAILAAVVIAFFPAAFHSDALAREKGTFMVEIPAENAVFMVGEELVYNVSYSFFDLGEVKLQITDTTTKMGKKIFIAKAYIDSYSGIPFVNLHQVFYSEMTAAPYSMYFTVHNTADAKAIQYLTYEFQYPKNKALYEMGVRQKKTADRKGSETVTTFQQDGLSLFYYARTNFRNTQKVQTPIFINEKSAATEFNFTGKIGSQEIDAVTYPVETIEFDGNANFIGIFGLTGYFQGFFSNDAAAVPIVAKMKVLVGSIHIELTKWSRPGWIPPRANG
jgi:hypothetical protein